MFKKIFFIKILVIFFLLFSALCKKPNSVLPLLNIISSYVTLIFFWFFECMFCLFTKLSFLLKFQTSFRCLRAGKYLFKPSTWCGSRAHIGISKALPKFGSWILNVSIFFLSMFSLLTKHTFVLKFQTSFMCDRQRKYLFKSNIWGGFRAHIDISKV